jgi:hypothetical protein
VKLLLKTCSQFLKATDGWGIFKWPQVGDFGWPPGSLHLIVDNYGTHKHPKVQKWLKRHPRFHMHFIPTSSSWVNMVERWFAEISRKRIRRGSFKNVKELISTIKQYIESHNQNPKVLVWTASVESIMNKIKITKDLLETLH